MSGLIGSSDVRFFQRVDKHILGGVRFLDARLGHYGSPSSLRASDSSTSSAVAASKRSVRLCRHHRELLATAAFSRSITTSCAVS